MGRLERMQAFSACLDSLLPFLATTAKLRRSIVHAWITIASYFSALVGYDIPVEHGAFPLLLLESIFPTLLLRCFLQPDAVSGIPVNE